MNSAEIRSKAWDSLKGNYWPAVLAAFLAAIFGALHVGGGSINNADDRPIADIISGIPVACEYFYVAIA